MNEGGLFLAAMAVLIMAGVVFARRQPDLRTVSLPGLQKALAGTGNILGRTVGRGYMLEQRLALGEHSILFLARPPQGNKQVVVKLVRPGQAENEELAARFRREASICRRLNHPNLVKILDTSTEEDELLYIVMEYHPRGSLRELLADGRLDPAQARTWMLQVSRALQLVHEHGVIHRDIKPENVLLTESGDACLMDFGLARSTGSASLTQAGSTLGTPQYMSPEQIRNRGVDHRSDIYSLGIMFYEAFTGQLPFPGTNALAVMVQQIEARPAVPEALPPVLRKLVLKMLEKDPASRPQSMAEVVETLERC